MSELLKKYESIDQSKLNEGAIKILNRVKTITSDFTTDDAKNNKIAEDVLNEIMKKYPDSVKIVKRTSKTKPAPKKVAKAKKPATTSTAKKSGNNIMSVAKEIQKAGESWNDAMERAKQVLKERREQVIQKQKTELEKLYALVKTKKELQGFAKSDIQRDAVRDAKPRGARVVTKEGSTSNQYGTFRNKLGRKYWETRDRHADRLAPNYPKDMPLLASGGGIDGGMTNLTMQNVSFEKGGIFYKEGSNKYGLGNTEIFVQEENDMYCVYDNVYNDESENWGIKKIDEFDTMDEAKEFAIEYSKKEFADGGSVSNERMYNFLKDDLAQLEEAIKSGDMEEVNKFFTYWLGSSGHLKSLETKTNEKMYNFLKEDLEKLEVAVENNDTEDVERFFSYWGQHLESLKMANGGSLQYLTDPNFGNFQNTGMFADGGDLEKYKLELYGMDYAFVSSAKLGDLKRNYAEEIKNKGYKIFDLPESHPDAKRGNKWGLFKPKSFELGGAFMTTDLAGHSGGGTGGLNANLPLNGFSGTNYTGLVGETGAMSSGELFMDGGAVAQNQQVIDGASQSYVNYYLANDGISQASYKDGGAIENQYEGKTPEEIWNSLSKQQRGHFLYDHVREIEEYKNIERLPSSEIIKAYNSEWSSLDKDIKNRFANHTREGQYASGGVMEKNQQVIDDASQSYINYYLGEGASQGIYRDGGSLGEAINRKNKNYAYGGRTKSRPSMRELYIENIAFATNTRTAGVDAFAKEHNLTDSELSNLMTGIGRKMISQSDFITALVGNKNNPKQKEVVAFAKSDKAYKMADGGFTPDVSDGTAFMNDAYFLGGGQIDEEFNKKVQKLADKKGLTMDALGRNEYNKVMTQALVESLNDANFHAEAKQVVLKAEGKSKWSDDLYRAESFNPDEKVNDFAREVSKLAIWDADYIINAYYFITKMQGSKVASMIENLFLNPKPKKSVFIPTVEFNAGDIVWQKDEERYATVMNNYGDPINGNYGNIRLDTTGNTSIYTFDPNRKSPATVNTATGYNLVKLGEKGDTGKFTPEVVAEMKESAKGLIDSRKERKDTEMIEYYEGIYKRLLDGEFDSMTKGTPKPKKYIDHDDIKSVTLKLKGKVVTIAGKDVLNGANLMEKGGDLSKIANYVPKRDVVEVELKEGSKVKPLNGYWVKKGSSYADGGFMNDVYANGGELTGSFLAEIKVPYNYENVVRDEFEFTEFLSKALTKKWFGNGVWGVSVVKPLFEKDYSQKIVVKIDIPVGVTQGGGLDKFDVLEFMSKTLTKKWFGNGIWGVDIVKKFADGGSFFEDNDGFMKSDNEFNYRYINREPKIDVLDEEIDLTSNFEPRRMVTDFSPENEEIDLSDDGRVRVIMTQSNRGSDENFGKINPRAFEFIDLPMPTSNKHKND
jgi:hypothetical protein